MRRKGPIKDIVRKIKKAKARNGRELRGNGAGELVGSEVKVLEVAKVGYIGGENTGEIKTREVKGGDMTASGVTSNAMPRAERVGTVPGGKSRLGVINGGFEREKSLVFIDDTSKGNRDLEVEQEEEKKEKPHFW